MKEVERGAGIITYTLSNENKPLFLILKGGATIRGFPKGHIEDGELPLQAAKRETFEETGINPPFLHSDWKVVDRFMVRKNLTTGKVYKIPKLKFVTYFLGRTNNLKVKLSDEHTDYRWVPYSVARNMLRFNKDLLENVMSYLKLYYKKIEA